MKEPKALGEYCYLHAFTYQNSLFWCPEQTVLTNKPIDLTRQRQWVHFLH